MSELTNERIAKIHDAVSCIDSDMNRDIASALHELAQHRARLARPQPEGRLRDSTIASWAGDHRFTDVQSMALEIQHRRSRDPDTAEHAALSSLLAHVEQTNHANDAVLIEALRRVLGKPARKDAP